MLNGRRFSTPSKGYAAKTEVPWSQDDPICKTTACQELGVVSLKATEELHFCILKRAERILNQRYNRLTLTFSMATGLRKTSLCN